MADRQSCDHVIYWFGKILLDHMTGFIQSTSYRITPNWGKGISPLVFHWGCSITTLYSNPSDLLLWNVLPLMKPSCMRTLWRGIEGNTRQVGVADRLKCHFPPFLPCSLSPKMPWLFINQCSSREVCNSGVLGDSHNEHWENSQNGLFVSFLDLWISLILVPVSLCRSLSDSDNEHNKEVVGIDVLSVVWYRKSVLWWYLPGYAGVYR